MAKPEMAKKNPFDYVKRIFIWNGKIFDIWKPLDLVKGKRQTLSVGGPNGNVIPISYVRNNLSLQMAFLTFEVLP